MNLSLLSDHATSVVNVQVKKLKDRTQINLFEFPVLEINILNKE